MKTTKRLLTALLAALLTLTLAACDKDSGGGKVDVPATQTGTDDFQKNLHQTDEMYFLETDTGYYVGYGYLYYIDKETMKMTIVCGKPECDHTDTDRLPTVSVLSPRQTMVSTYNSKALMNT